jgi:hypothetical protein
MEGVFQQKRRNGGVLFTALVLRHSFPETLERIQSRLDRSQMSGRDLRRQRQARQNEKKPRQHEARPKKLGFHVRLLGTISPESVISRESVRSREASHCSLAQRDSRTRAGFHFCSSAGTPGTRPLRLRGCCIFRTVGNCSSERRWSAYCPTVLIVASSTSRCYGNTTTSTGFEKNIVRCRTKHAPVSTFHGENADMPNSGAETQKTGSCYAGRNIFYNIDHVREWLLQREQPPRKPVGKARLSLGSDSGRSADLTRSYIPFVQNRETRAHPAWKGHLAHVHKQTPAFLLFIV